MTRSQEQLQTECQEKTLEVNELLQNHPEEEETLKSIVGANRIYDV